MNKLRLLICGILLVCTSVVFAACGDKDFKTEDVKLGQNEFVYDGNSHIYDITYKDTKIEALYSLDGEKFTEKDKLAVINAGTYKVYFKISAKGYKEYTGSHDVIIKKATINPDNVAFGATSFQYDGTKKIFDVGYGNEQVEVKYSLDAGESKTYVTKDQMNIVDAGTYTVFYSVSSPNFETFYSQKTMVIANKVLTAQDVTVEGAQDGKVTYTYTGASQIFDVAVAGLENATVEYSLDAGETKTWVSKANFPVLGTDAANNDKPRTVFFKVSATNYADYIGSVIVSIQQTQFTADDFNITTNGTYTGSAQSFNIEYVGTKIAKPEAVIYYTLWDCESEFDATTAWKTSTDALNIVNAGQYTVYYYVNDQSTKALHARYGVKELSAATLADAKSFTYTVNKANLADFGVIEADTNLVYTNSVKLPIVSFEANEGVTVEPTIMFAATEDGTYYTRADALNSSDFENYKNAGDYTVYVKAVVGDSTNYTEIKQTINFTVAKSSKYVDISVSGGQEIGYNAYAVPFPTISKSNDQANTSLWFAASEDGTYYSSKEEAIKSGDFDKFIKVATHTVYVKAVPEDLDNYNIVYTSVTFDVIKATAGSSMYSTQGEFTYNGEKQEPKVTVHSTFENTQFSYSLQFLDATETGWKSLDELGLDFVNASEKATKIYYRVRSDNYNDIVSSFDFIINKAKIQVEVGNVYQFAGEAKVEPTYNILSGQTLDSNKVKVLVNVENYNENATAGTTFDIKASLSGDKAFIENCNLVANVGTYFVVGLDFDTVASKMTEIMNTVYNNEALLGKETNYTFAEINEKLTAVNLAALEGYYMEVAAADTNLSQLVVVNGVKYGINSKFELSIGNANYIVDKAFIIENDKMKIACPVIAAMIENIETTQLTNIKVFGANDGIVVKKVESETNANEYNLTITSGKTMLFITIDGVTLTADDMFISKKVKNGSTTFGSSKTDPYNVNGETGYAVAVYPIGWVEDITTVENKTFDFEYTVTLPNKGVIKCLFHITIDNGTTGE